MDDQQHHDEDEFNPVGTAWIMAGFIVLIVLFWGWAYLEMLILS